jgi:hypothetical protein
MKNQKFNPVEVILVNNQFVLIKNEIVIESKELGSFPSRQALSDTMDSLGIKRAKFSREAHDVIFKQAMELKAEKAQAKAIAKAEKDAAWQRAKIARAEERAQRKIAKDLAWEQAKLARAEERARIKAEKLALKANSVKNKAKVATVKIVEETVEELEAA